MGEQTGDPDDVIPAPSINIDDDDDDIDNRMDIIADSDSDASTSIPQKVKRITLLQKKVAQLEAILKEYRNKEMNRNNGDDQDNDNDVEYDNKNGFLFDQEPSNQYKKNSQSKGNIV